MNGESKSGERSWEEWVEHLTRLPENEQFAELLNKTKELKDKNTSLKHDIAYKSKYISLFREYTTAKDNEIKRLRYQCKALEENVCRLKEEQKRLKHFIRLLTLLSIICFISCVVSFLIL